MLRALTVLVMLCVLWGTPAAAFNPLCGEAISGTWAMTGDLDCSGSVGHGVTLNPFATLNCNGFKIIGPDLLAPEGSPTGRYGLRVDEAENVTILNCHVKGFERGINVSASTNVLIQNGTSRKNTKYGVNVGVGSGHVTIDNMQAINNGDEGMHFGGPFTGPITIQGSLAYLNWEEGFYFHRAAGAVLRDSIATNNSQNPSGSHPDINLDETTDMVIVNVGVGNLVRTIAQPQASLSLCVSSIPAGCQ